MVVKNVPEKLFIYQIPIICLPNYKALYFNFVNLNLKSFKSLWNIFLLTSFLFY